MNKAHLPELMGAYLTAAEASAKTKAKVMAERKVLVAKMEEEIKPNALKKFLTVSPGQLKNKSDGFKLIHYYAQWLDLDEWSRNPKQINRRDLNKINSILGGLVTNDKFSKVNFENTYAEETQYLFCLYRAMKAITAAKPNSLNGETLDKFVWVASELGLRLHSLFIETRPHISEKK